MIGRTISHYRVIEKIGEGGMGVVYLAEHTLLGRRVAIKTLMVGGAGNQHFRSRFLREAQAISKLSHPNIANIYDYGETDDGQPYIVMELVEGKTLNEVMRAETLTIPRATEIVKQVAEALSEAHRHGIVHRDIKPSNIAINERGIVKVLDFGLAKHAPSAAMSAESNHSSAVHTQTREGVIVGTPLYLSPEQALGLEVDARSDLFSLGSVLYECIAGRPPFTGKSDIDICAKVIRDEPLPPSEFNSDVSPKLDQVTLKALAKKREGRYQTATELIADLVQLHQKKLSSRHADEPKGVSTSRLFLTSSIARVSNLLKRPRLSVGYLLLTIGILGLVGLILWRFGKPSLYQPNTQSKTQYDRAVEAMHEGSFFRASKLLQEVLKDDDRFELAHARLAEAYAELDESDKSKDELIRAQELVPDPSVLSEVDSQRWLAIINVVKRQFGEAAANYGALAASVPAAEKQYALVDLGRAQEKNGETDKAIASYEQAIRLDANHAAAYLRLGVVYGRRRSQQDAFHVFDQAYKLFDTNSEIEGLAEVSLQRGVLLTQSGRVVEASEQLMNALDKAKALEHRDKQIRVLLNLSNNFIFAGNPSQAQLYSTMATDLAQANKMENLTAQGLIDIGNAYFVKGNYPEAEKNFQEALRLAQLYKGGRSEARAYLSLASLQTHLNKPAAARSFCELALPFYKLGGYRKELSQLYTILGHAQDQTGEYDQALQTFQQQLHDGQEVGDQQQMGWAHEGLGVVFNHKENYPQALTHFGEQHKLFNQLANATLKSYAAMNQGTMYWQLADYDSAATLLNEALVFAENKDTPNKELQAWIHVSKARMELSRDRFSEAIREGNLALEIAGTEMKAIIIQATSTRGLALSALGRKPEGLLDCEQAVRLAKTLDDPLPLSQALLALAQAALKSGDPDTAIRNALEAQKRFADRAQHESEWRCWLVLWLASKAGSGGSEDSAIQARRVFSDLQTEWGRENFLNYRSRKDVGELLAKLG